MNLNRWALAWFSVALFCLKLTQELPTFCTIFVLLARHVHVGMFSHLAMAAYRNGLEILFLKENSH